MKTGLSKKQSLCSTRRGILLKKQTNAEKVFEIKLKELGIKFVSQKGFIAGNNFCIVDFYLPKPYKLCIEIDGGYHSTQEQKKRDSNRTSYLENERGFRVVRFSNEEAFSMTLEQIKDRLVS